MRELLAEDIHDNVFHAVMRLAMAGEAADAVELAAQGHDCRLLLALGSRLAHLAEPDASKKTIADAPPLVGVSF